MLIPHHLKGKHIGVLGLGRSGVSVCQALAQVPDITLYVHDDLLGDTARVVGEAVGDTSNIIVAKPEAWRWRDLAYVVVSPGVPLRHPTRHQIAQLADTHGVALVGDIEIAMQCFQDTDLAVKIIGITGTNGKSTTAALTAHVLQTAGVETMLVGNIGTPMLTMDMPKSEAVIVLELSSYQLELTPSLRLTAAAILNITPDHLDRHGGWDGYVAAKAKIGEAIPDKRVLVVGDDAACRAIAAGHKNAQTFAQTFDASIVGVTPLPPSLTGQHNRLNAAAAVQLIEAVDIGLTRADLLPHLASFPGLPHRLELIGNWQHGDQHIAFVNDSKATNAVAAAQALASYSAIYWIVGGEMKADDLATITQPFADRVKYAFVIGADTKKTLAMLPDEVTAFESGSLNKAVDEAFAYAVAEKGNQATILLAPAAASFDQFANFEARGDQFRQLAQARIKNPSPPVATPPTPAHEAQHV